MLPLYLQEFNSALQKFQEVFPREKWTENFKESLINDYSFYSARIEDEKLQYGDTIRFLNNEFVRVGNMISLLNISNHTQTLKSLLSKLENFVLSEDIIKGIHYDLMHSELAWEVGFRPELIGQYRNIPTVGAREPYFRNKEYAPHYNLKIIMSSYIDIFKNRISNINNNYKENHLLIVLSYFHNKFLNTIHPFADGNGRVCRMIMGAVMMKYGCPPVFPEIKDDKDQFEYIDTIVKCELQNSDEPLIQYLSEGITKSLLHRINNVDQ